MTIRPNLLQGVFFWVFGALTATVLIIGVVTLLPLLASPAKSDYGEFPKLLGSNTSSFVMIMSSCVVWTVAYSTHRRKMDMSLPMRTKTALFALGMAFNAGVGFSVYLWARGVL